MSHQPLTNLAPDWAGFDQDLRESGEVSKPGEAADFARFAIDGMRPERVVRPTSIPQVCRVMESASARGLAVVPAGFGAHLGLGAAPGRPFLALVLGSLNELVEHQPANMTLTAQAGMSLAQLQAVAARAGQWLPVDPPLPAEASVGGLISANLSGPSRFSQGTVRDLLIGITVVRADGSLVKSGGRVVKNVAGYDMGKLYCGSLGTLGVIVEATFKLRTIPRARAVMRMTCPDMARVEALLERIMTAPLEPLFIELVAHVPAAGAGYVVVVGFGGAPEDVADQGATLTSLVAAEDRLEELAGEEASVFLEELRDSRVLGEGSLRLKASLLPARLSAFMAALEKESQTGELTMAVQAHAGNGIIQVRVVGADGPDPRGSMLGSVERLRAEAVGLGGTLVVEQAAAELKPDLDLWGGGIEGLALMQRIKQTLDPGGILSPGRFVGGI
ncbi:MAG: FAD-binding oxidoreductase [Deltaproteobacteria bacterium]|nr:FAD-binding oxidoreductase [Deltaproteobacteria bacterium]